MVQGHNILAAPKVQVDHFQSELGQPNGNEALNPSGTQIKAQGS
jgi:hypothetical protein